MELAALLIILAGGAYIAYAGNSTVNNAVINLVNTPNFTDHNGNHKYFSPLKMQAWADVQTQINLILTSPQWESWRRNHSFRVLTNGGKIDAVFEQIDQNYAGAYHGYTHGVGGDSFSYLDFVYPGIDLNNLGAGSENQFELLWNDLNITCIGTVLSGATATALTGGAVSIPATVAAGKACKIH